MDLLSALRAAVADLSWLLTHGYALESALKLVGKGLIELRAGPVAWFLDRPVSNSGRLAERMRSLAEARGWDWRVEMVLSPDREVVEQVGWLLFPRMQLFWIVLPPGSI